MEYLYWITLVCVLAIVFKDLIILATVSMFVIITFGLYVCYVALSTCCDSIIHHIKRIFSEKKHD